MVTYNSHIKNLRVALTPAKPIFEGGIKVGDTLGKHAQFVGGQFQTNDKESIEKLEKLSTFGVDFWKVSDEPAQTTPKDRSQQNKESDLESLTKAELLALAKEKKIEVDEGLNKAEIIERIKTQ